MFHGHGQQKQLCAAVSKQEASSSMWVTLMAAVSAQRCMLPTMPMPAKPSAVGFALSWLEPPTQG